MAPTGVYDSYSYSYSYSWRYACRGPTMAELAAIAEELERQETIDELARLEEEHRRACAAGWPAARNESARTPTGHRHRRPTRKASTYG